MKKQKGSIKYGFMRELQRTLPYIGRYVMGLINNNSPPIRFRILHGAVCRGMIGKTKKAAVLCGILKNIPAC